MEDRLSNEALSQHQQCRGRRDSKEGSGVLLGRITSSSADTVGYSPDREEHATTPSYCIVRT